MVKQTNTNATMGCMMCVGSD